MLFQNRRSKSSAEIDAEPSGRMTTSAAHRLPRLFTAGLLLAVLQTTASGALVSKDLNSVGDGLITHDEDTLLEWLDVTATQNMSVNTALATFAGDGWNVADGTLIWELWQHGGYFAYRNNIEYDPAEYPGIYNATVDLINLLGVSVNSTTSTYSSGFHDTGAGYAYAKLAASTTSYNPPWYYNASATFSTITVDPSIGVSNNGVWMYRSAAVPVPAAAWLFGSAMLGLIGWSRRRRA